MRRVQLLLTALTGLAACTGPGPVPVDKEDTGGCEDRAWYRDNDADGFGDPARGTASACVAPEGYAPASGDCDDADAAVFPGADETCDGEDDDCDGAADEDAVGAPAWYADADRDGFGDPGAAVAACSAPPGHLADATDCDDTDPDVAPGAWELCGGVDDDCDGVVDEDALDAPAWYVDLDGDGFGDATQRLDACDEPAGHVSDDTDCDDADPTVSPGEDERCDGEDDDCDGRVDEAGAVDAAWWYADTDGDGFGDAAVDTPGCAAPAGFVADATDCDDGDATVSPARSESCGGADEDCDGTVDEPDAADAPTWFADADADTFGDPAAPSVACTAPPGFVGDATDCDDADATTSPAAIEQCDGADDDCDGAVDEPDAVDALAWYADTDGDGFGAVATGSSACAAPLGFVADATDCDDTNPAIAPSAPETCASPADDDCDGAIDEDSAIDAPSWYADSDIDGFCDYDNSGLACIRPYGYVVDATDCDDADPAARPGLVESCLTEADDDCSGDNYGVDLPGCLDWYVDADGDGAGAGDAVCACHPHEAWVVATGDDCDDTDAEIGPGVPERWGDTVDQSCDGDPDGELLEDSAFELLGEVPVDVAGRGVAAAGDLDGDGYADLIVGAPLSDRVGISSGAVYVVSGPVTADGSLADADHVLLGAGASGFAGWAVAGGGDADGDGVLDLLVGAPFTSSPRTQCGAAYLLAAPTTAETSLTAATASFVGTTASQRLGSGLAFGGDLDGDGIDEVVVGAPGDATNGTGSGLVAVFAGPSAGAYDVDDADAKLFGNARSEALGLVVTSVGDTDGDGLPDLLVGAPEATLAGFGTGAAFLFHGMPATGIVGETADAVLVGEVSEDEAGASIAAAGDVNGDGYADILVGAPSEGATNAGRAYLVYSPPPASLPLADAAAVVSGLLSHGRVGGAVGGASDLDGDGRDDLVVTADGETARGNVGAVHVFLTPPDGAVDVDSADATLYGERYQSVGFNLAMLGDTDGDGLGDLLLGAPTGTSAGGVWVWAGH